MGLFDKLKNKKSTTEENVNDFVNNVSEDEAVAEKEAEVAQEAETVADTVETEAAAPVQDNDEPRRFTMLVEQTFQLEKDEGILVVGDVYGKIRQGDRIYVLLPNNRMVLAGVDEMEVGPGRATKEAENDKVAIRISEIKRKELVPQFTIITNITPNPDAKEGRELENPLLLGITMEYPKRGQEPTYNNLLVYFLCHTRYVVPASLTGVSEANGAAQQVRFPTLPDAHDPNKHILPVFTDWNALSNWKGLFSEEHPEHSVIMTFQEAVAVCKGEGIVINPFGPMMIVITAENIMQIVNLDSYKKEFGAEAKKEEMPPQNAQQSKAPRVILGVPRPDNPEVKAVTDAMVAYARQDASIKRIDLLLKTDMQSKKSFVCIVDCPQDQTSRIAEGILKATAYQRKEVETIEFFLLGAAKFIDDMVSEQSVIYRK